MFLQKIFRVKQKKINFLKDILFYQKNRCVQNRHISSALFISGDKASETFSVLTPHIDFDERIKNKSEISENIKKRQKNVDLDEIITSWIFYKKFLTQRDQLELKRTQIAKSIKNLDPTKDKNEIEKLINHGKIIKNDLKTLRESFYEVEQNAMVKVLSLPNIIHEKAPLQERNVIFEFKIANSDSAVSFQNGHHLEIGKQLNVLDFRGNDQYFFKNDGALFELGITKFFLENMLQKGYVEFSNADFVKSVIVEGCGYDFWDRQKVFTLNENDILEKRENSRLHLVGGASLPSFMAYFCKNTIFETQLPLKFVTAGRKYLPNLAGSESSLFNVTQSSCVDIFLATKDDEKSQNEMIDQVTNEVIEIYKDLGYDFRISYAPVINFDKNESLRISVELFSDYRQKFVEVGYVSVLDNYVSKRLLFNYGTSHNLHFPKILSGSILNVPKILGCLLETNPNLLKNEKFNLF